MHPSPAIAEPMRFSSTYLQHKLLKPHSTLNDRGIVHVLRIILFRTTKTKQTKKKTFSLEQKLEVHWAHCPSYFSVFLFNQSFAWSVEGMWKITATRLLRTNFGLVISSWLLIHLHIFLTCCHPKTRYYSQKFSIVP